MATKRSSTLAKGLALLSAAVRDGGQSTLSALARRERIPLATAHRLAATLEDEGFLERQSKSCFLPGPKMNELRHDSLRPEQRLAARLRRPLEMLARRHGVLLHFGIFEDGMVTYLVKENGGDLDLFTAETMQLEAYCSAIGKVLLANLPEQQLAAYLQAGPFVKLTANTITQPTQLRVELETVKTAEMAFDRYEIREDLFCFAIPVLRPDGTAIGGLSASFIGGEPPSQKVRSIKRSLKRLALGGLREVRGSQSSEKGTSRV